MSSAPDSFNNSDEQLERAPKNETGVAKSKAIWAAVGVGMILTIGAIAIMNATAFTPATPVVATTAEPKSTTAQVRHTDEDKANADVKQTLDIITLAEFKYVNIPLNNGVVIFGNMEDLKENKLLDSTSELFAANQSQAIASGKGSTAHYGASSISPFGKVFYTGDRKTQPVEVIKFDPADITTEMKLKAAAEAGLSGDFDGDFTN